MLLLSFAFFATLLIACLEFMAIIKLNNIIDVDEQEYFLIETERDTLRDRNLYLQKEIENLKTIQIEKAPKKKGRKPKINKEN